ncbi:MAG: GNAT family N-acetyltransferase [Nanoarchaeota archaeon]|nr:GNAT family N-acetyltransferase [Nanoarchaeota archaeon]MBU1988523.1 GNAT family N-acetyltransferase [Nanoarchaeota archaeon]
MNLKLRNPTEKDLPQLHKQINDKEIHKNIPEIPYPCSLKITKNILKDMIKENKEGKKKNFIIKINGNIAGAAGLTKLSKKHKAEVWLWIGKDYRGKGVGRKVLKFVTKLGFEKLKLKRIYGTLLASNRASENLLKKCEYKKEGTLKKNVKIKNKFVDELIYAIIK